MKVTEQQLERQLEIEQEYIQKSLTESKRLILEAIKGGRTADLLPVQRLIGVAYSTVCSEIDTIKSTKGASVGGKYIKLLRGVKTDVLAAASLSLAFQCLGVAGLSPSVSTQQILAKLGGMVQGELLGNQLKKIAPAYMNRVHEYLREKNTKSQTHIMKTYRASAQAVHLEHEPWSNPQCIGVGKLLMQALYSTGLFKWELHTGGMHYLAPSDAVLGVITDVQTEADFVRITPPMIVPPVPHRDLFDGGYLNHHTDKRGTYRHKNLPRKDLKRINEAFVKAEYLRSGLNKAQEVPYCINKYILNLVHTARGLGIGIGMPSTIGKPRPKWYLDGIPKEQYTPEELEDFTEWKIQCVTWHDQERERIQQLQAIKNTIEMAEEFKNEPRLFFPTCVDWRYRFYFKSRLNPQGSDLQKAMLLFSTKKPLGERGLFWLKVHCATQFGYDNKRFELRAKWFDENESIIREMLQDPLNSSVLAQADSPWCFLAACLETISAIDSGSPSEYLSNVPVAMDATNSGSQHYAGMTRDEVAGRLVNLYSTGADEKADLYMDVVERVNSKLILDTNKPDKLVQSRYWQVNPMTRSMSKRPTMTYTYSATDQSRTKYLYLGATDEGYTGIDGFGLFSLCVYLTPLVRDSIADANPKAAEAMKFFQDIVRRMPKDTPLEWYTPVGGLVINQYADIKQTRVDINSMGLTRVVAYRREFNKTNKRKAGAGVAPNLVHGCDASHLCMVINAFDGDIMPIHDSVATHACDVDTMHGVIREQFVKLYKHFDPIQHLYEQGTKLGADLSDLSIPPKGNLDLELVKDSEFFFC